MKFSLKTFIWLTMFVALALASAFTLIPKPVAVEFATATIVPLRVTVQEDGKTRIREKYIVSAPVSGRISRIELDAGDHCDEKTLLAVILPSDPAILDSRARAEANARVLASEAALQRANSSAEQARINHELSESKLERAETLLASRAISQEQYDVVRAESLAAAQAIKTASFDTEIARFELEMAEAAVDQFSDKQKESSAEPFEIYAPISGRVLRVFEESSTVVAVGTPLLELGDPSNLEIEIDVLSTDAVRIKPGAELMVEHWGGDTPLSGNVRVIEPGAFTKISSLGVEEQRVNIIADFNEPAERIASLGDGYRIEARITVKELSKALQIPNSALFRHQRKWHVLSIVDGKANLQPVQIGLQSESETEITDGLSAGDRVIVYPSDAIRPGTAVKPVPRVP
ncbi:Macrolide export protein MacA [Rosistilla carotiformis]|uniref:Macrolide export protein MacA n=1 Tax=Rosistilla carotiformis TaxID=2528017 RepID=A0A518JXI1_9BACT|nr:efflux RND transporter periplasmic adaptor subunit [Rosistilla carotiformis]QDV70257.1 Macrolide export protein MacA [Rosistilla carotiformis]